MSKFTLARAVFACVGTLLLLAGCNSKDDAQSAFPDKLRTQVRLRAGPAKEKTRIVHYAEDKVTPLWAEVLMTNDHTRNVYYEKKRHDAERRVLQTRRRWWTLPTAHLPGRWSQPSV